MIDHANRAGRLGRSILFGQDGDKIIARLAAACHKLRLTLRTLAPLFCPDPVGSAWRGRNSRHFPEFTTIQISTIQISTGQISPGQTFFGGDELEAKL